MHGMGYSIKYTGMPTKQLKRCWANPKGKGCAELFAAQPTGGFQSPSRPGHKNPILDLPGGHSTVASGGDSFGIVAYTDPKTFESIDYCFSAQCWASEKSRTGADLKNCIKGRALGTGSVQDRCGMYDPNGPQSMFGLDGLGSTFLETSLQSKLMVGALAAGVSYLKTKNAKKAALTGGLVMAMMHIIGQRV